MNIINFAGNCSVDVNDEGQLYVSESNIVRNHTDIELSEKLVEQEIIQKIIHTSEYVPNSQYVYWEIYFEGWQVTAGETTFVIIEKFNYTKKQLES
jgi:hypothetical protein